MPLPQRSVARRAIRLCDDWSVQSISLRVAQMAELAARRLHVRSALNPVLWLCAIVVPLCFSFAWLFRDDHQLRNVLVYFGLLPVAVACAIFVYFAIRKPEKLQSEDYQIRHESIQLLQQKSGVALLNPISLEAIANPEVKKLPPGDDQ